MNRLSEKSEITLFNQETKTKKNFTVGPAGPGGPSGPRKPGGPMGPGIPGKPRTPCPINKQVDREAERTCGKCEVVTNTATYSFTLGSVAVQGRTTASSTVTVFVFNRLQQTKIIFYSNRCANAAH